VESAAQGEGLRVAVGGEGGGLGDGAVLTGGWGGETSYLSKGGPVIGLFDEFVYEQETVQTARGDVLVAYTDGVTEALSPRGEEYGQERLEALARAHAHLSAEALTQRIIEDLRQWCRNTPQHDDVTLVVAKVK